MDAAGQIETRDSETRDSMQERIDDILEAHGGDARSAIEMLLIYGDGVANSLSFGYVRGRIVTSARLGRRSGRLDAGEP